MLDTIQSRSFNGSQSSRFNITFDQTMKPKHGYVCGVTILPSYDSKGVVIDITTLEQCCSPFKGEPELYYTPEKPFQSSSILSARSKIYFEKSSFHLSNGDPNIEQHIVTNNLIAWTSRTMKDNLVSFEAIFKHLLFLEDKDPVSEDWMRSKFKELATSDYGEQIWRVTTKLNGTKCIIIDLMVENCQ
jgi:hypothetical protein